MRLTIDAMQFARDGLSTEGEIASDRLARVRDAGATAGNAWFRVTGQHSAIGKPALGVEVRCSMTMECQRCLEPVALEIDEAVELELCEDQREIDAADDDVDRVLASPALHVTDLVEDEILLAMPMVARHTACEPPADAASAVGEDESGPWAALARLRQS